MQARDPKDTHQTKPSLILTAYSTVQYSTVSTVQYSLLVVQVNDDPPVCRTHNM